MNDLIRRKDATQALCKWCNICPREVAHPENCEIIGEAIISIPPADNWIPVTERLPKHSGRYLVTIRPNCPRDSDYTDVRYYGKPLGSKRRRAWYFFDSSCGDVVDDNVIAWQPLPEPYKGGEQ